MNSVFRIKHVITDSGSLKLLKFMKDLNKCCLLKHKLTVRELGMTTTNSPHTKQNYKVCTPVLFKPI